MTRQRTARWRSDAIPRWMCFTLFVVSGVFVILSAIANAPAADAVLWGVVTILSYAVLLDMEEESAMRGIIQCDWCKTIQAEPLHILISKDRSKRILDFCSDRCLYDYIAAHKEAATP